MKRSIRSLPGLHTLVATLVAAAVSSLSSTGSACEPSCVTIQRGSFSDVADSDLCAGNGGWAAGAYSYLWTGGSAAQPHRALLRFDTSVIPPDATVTSAQATIYEQWNASFTTVYAHQIVNPWSEATVSWPNFGSNASFDPTAFASFAAGGGGPKMFDVTALAVDWVSGAAENDGILLEEDLSGGPGLHAYAASEWSNASQRPKLEVCYTTPEDPGCGGPACVAQNGACGADGDCCDGLSCLFGACADASACAASGATCDAAGPDTCCAGAACGFSLTPCQTGNGSPVIICPGTPSQFTLYQCCGGPLSGGTTCTPPD